MTTHLGKKITHMMSNMEQLNLNVPSAPKPEWGEWGVLRQKQKAQVKSKFYYIFWGVATASVVLGQVYVGSGYRQMSRSFNRIMDAIVVEIEGSMENPRRFY